MYQTLGVNGRAPPKTIESAMGGMGISPSQSNGIPSRPAPRPPAIQTTYAPLDKGGPPTPGTPASMVSTYSTSPSFPPSQQQQQRHQDALPVQSTVRPTPQLTPPTSSSSPNGTTGSTTATSMSQKFTPQRAAPLTPSQRQEQVSREAERRKRERQERENKELPPLNATPSKAPPQVAPLAPSRLPVAVGSAATRPAPDPPKPHPAAAAATTATTSKPKVREQRISALTETQIMEKLRSVVTHADPNNSYSKIKKVGQGASGSVYVARYTSSSPLKTKMANGTQITQGHKVAIKQMDLANQPRKELIVNEILVMKESQHPNIVNFLDSYLVRGNELWVVMEFMEGGALTDVIDHNTLSEDQISCICLEVPQPPTLTVF